MVKAFKELLSKNAMTVVKFTASWCGPCKECQPFVKNCVECLPENIKYMTVDIDDYPRIKRYMRVKVVPTFWCFVGDEQKWVAEGSDQTAILNFFKRIVAEYNKL